MPSFSERPARPRGGGHGHGRGPSSGMSRRVGIYRVSPDVASRVTAGRPWVFRDALGSRELVEPAGTVVGFFSGDRGFVARAATRRVLNLFSHTGAFSVYAAKAGAAEVVAVDLAAKSHARARRNYELSGLDPAKMEAVPGDAVKAVERCLDRGRRFDLGICAPPSFSQGPAGTFSVAKDLARLAYTAAGVLEPGGLLAFATNSAKVSSVELDRAMGEGAAAARAVFCF